MQIVAGMFWHGTSMARRSLPLLIKAAPECVVALVDNSCTAKVQGEAMYVVNQQCSYIFCITCVNFQGHDILRDCAHVCRWKSNIIIDTSL